MGCGFQYDSDWADTRAVTGTQCVLYRGGKWITIYSAAGCRPEKDADLEHKDPTFFLGLIQTMLDDIDFSQANTAFLVRHLDGSRRLVYNEKHAPHGKAWAPLIDENEIVFDKWRDWGTWRGGWWNGIRVDVYIFYWEESMVHPFEVEGHRIMQSAGLTELTFEMVGHVTRHGCTVGHACKAIEGRLVEYRDRADVYEAITRMQAKGIIYRSIFDNDIYATDGGIHFTNLSSIILYDNETILEEAAQHWHWERLETMFEELKGNGVIKRLEVWDPAYPSEEIVIPRLPSPGREPSNLPNVSRFIRAYSAFLANQRAVWIQMGDLAPDATTVSTARHRPSKKWTTMIGDGDKDRFEEVADSVLESLPVNSSSISYRAPRHGPYSKPLLQSQCHRMLSHSRARKPLFVDAEPIYGGKWINVGQ